MFKNHNKQIPNQNKHHKSFMDPITDENGKVEHLFDDRPLFDEDMDYMDELYILDEIIDLF